MENWKVVKKHVGKSASGEGSQPGDSPEWCVLNDVDLTSTERATRYTRHETGDVIFYEGDAKGQFHESVTLSTRARFAQLLVVLQGRFGRSADDGSRQLTLPLSRSDLAAMLAVRRESITRLIHELESMGITHIEERGYRA
ncbi:MAG: helix-turn-helix domain-containing protein [Pseudomonadales bacterium]|nr:helix-turn-helix domain-containing protein [Pseudomonadales bacterium]